MRPSVAALVAALLLPGLASADGQTIASSFDQLQEVLPRFSIVIVVDTEGRTAWGRVIDLSPTTLTLALMQKREDGSIETTSERRSFIREEVDLILRSDHEGLTGTPIYPASWHRVDQQPRDARLTLELATGERRNYRFASSGADSLRVVTPQGTAETIEKVHITRVFRRGVNDSTRNGTLLGAAAGAGAGIAAAAIEIARCDPSCNLPSNEASFTLVSAALAASVGAVAGWTVDRAHKGTAALFPAAPARMPAVALAPLVSGNRRGLSVSFSWGR